MENKKVFVSYSWDSTNHQDWVLHLVNQLRKNGIDATADKFETQNNSIHLPQMMVDKIRDCDYIVIVLTENYAKKANQSMGGVGFESRLMLPLLLENPNKIICIMRHNGNYEKVFPFQLMGQYAIDFSDENQFDDSLTELKGRIHNQSTIFQEPLGEISSITPRIPKRIFQKELEAESKNSIAEQNLINFEMPNLKRITEKDINNFLKESFREIITLFNELYNKVQTANKEFEFDQDDVTLYKSIFTLYVDGTNVNTIKIWYGSMFGSNTINLAYGRQVSSSDNSTNEIISHHIDDSKNLKLKMGMNIFGNKEPMNPEEIVQEIWKTSILPTIR